MALGLIISVLGDRVVAGGVDGIVVAGAIPVIWVAISTTVEESIVFLFPAYARLLKKFSPDWTLITEDLAEAFLAFLATAALLLFPQWGLWPLIAYLLVLMLLTPVTDIADEFYGAKLARVSEKLAMDYNASIAATLSIAGFVVAVPLGAIIASQSAVAILLVNVALSLIGALTRARISRQVRVGPAIDEDESEFDVVGARMRARQFMHDLFRSGPASPALSFILGVIGALTGHLLLLWAAGLVGVSPFMATSLIFFVFGISAAAGPLIASRLAGRFSTELSLVVTAVMSVLNICWFAIYLGFAEKPSVVVAIGFIVVNVIVGRLRNTVLETHRQRFFKGSQYARVMSWSYAFGGAGTLIGMWLAYGMGVPTSPQAALWLAAILWIPPAILVASRVKPKESVSADRKAP
ncbi:MFS transporter [Devriesea agamarum]|uniref:MFS transporter n=1 Tax=Devriesea agamarum TaxID=472569 RepID=UPI0012EE833F|nr:MFS transporter [Devriesea agamarum]